jgi:lipopolysaccharide transport system permease protein
MSTPLAKQKPDSEQPQTTSGDAMLRADNPADLNTHIESENDQQVVVYTAESDLRSPVRLLGSILTQFGKGRELAWRLFVRNLQGMYRQTLLGLFWAFLPPLANTAIWVFLNAQKVITFENPLPVHYAVYVLTGMVIWQAFIDALQMPLSVIQTNRAMISKLNFPRESLLLVGAGEALFNLLIRVMLLVVVYICYGVAFQPSMLLAFVGLLGVFLLGAAIGLFLMPIGSLYQDVGRLLIVAIPFWMILSPIVYPTPTEMPGSLLVWLNPVGPLLAWTRDLMIQGHSTFALGGIIWLAVAIPLLLIGLIIYRVSIPTLVERMPA